MAKNKRGHVIKKAGNWRGTCPACSKARRKLLWETSVNGNRVKVCKQCRNKTV
ncbi:MAG: hypothetical protein ACRCSG_03510 [Cellulosilyticaceae bacterium]